MAVAGVAATVQSFSFPLEQYDSGKCLSHYGSGGGC